MRTLDDNSVDTIITDPPYSLSSIKRRFAKTSVDDENITGINAKNGANNFARLSSGFMGKDWDNEIAFNPSVWREALRVAKPGAFLFAMGGSRTYHRLAVAIEDAGWEIRDCITHFYDVSFAQQAFLESLNEEQLAAYLEIHYPGYMMHWVYGSGFPKSHDVSKSLDKKAGVEREVVGSKRAGIGRHGRTDFEVFHGTCDESLKKVEITAPATELAQHFSGWGSALKPAFEPICIAMKPLDGTFAQNAEKWGVSGLWIDGGRIGTKPRKTGTNNLHAISGVNGIYGKDKRTNRQQAYDLRQEQENKSRWPANVTHDSSDEVLAEFAKAGESVSKVGGKSYNKNTMFLQGKRPQDRTGHDDSGSPARFFYSAKASPSEKGKGNNHPTVKPLALMRYLCRLSKTPYGGVVLDPFAGSGSTLLAARAENREAIGIELEPDYCEIAVNRLDGKTDVSPNCNVDTESANGKTEQMRLF